MLLEIQEQSGITPKALETRPLPRVDCTKYREIFLLLSSQREINETGLQALPVREVVSYLDGMLVTDLFEREKVIRFTVSLDRVFMEHVRKKQEQNRQKT